MQSSALLKAGSTRSAYFKDEDFTASPMSDHPHSGEKKTYFFFYLRCCVLLLVPITSLAVTVHLWWLYLYLPAVTAASSRSCAPSACSPGWSSWVLSAAWSCPCSGELWSELSPPSGLWQELGRGEKCFFPLCQLCCGSYSVICGWPLLLQGCTSDWCWTGCALGCPCLLQSYCPGHMWYHPWGRTWCLHLTRLALVLFLNYYFFFSSLSRSFFIPVLPPACWLLTLNWFFPEACWKCTHSHCLNP